MNRTGPPAENGAPNPIADRLDSWKEIAAYLRRDESTVRRWEKAGLPVHRHRNNVRAVVFAYKAELDAWWHNGGAAPDQPPQPAPERRPVATPWIAAAGVVVLGLALVLSRFVLARSGGEASPPLRVSPFTSYSGSVRMPAFSPDGEKVAFSWTGPSAPGNWDIYVKTIGNGAPLRLTTDSAEDSPPAWSPDGRQIAFLRAKSQHVELCVTSVSGGPERKLIEVNNGRYFNLQWTRDGKAILFAEKTSPLVPYTSFDSSAIFLVSVDTLAKRQLTFPRHPESDHRFAVSPDGSTLAFLRHGYASGVGVFTMPMSGGAAKHLHTEPSWVGHIVWTADGRSVIFTSKREGGNTMFRLSTAGGEPQPLPIPEESAYSPSVAPKGDRLAYVREYFDIDLMRVDLGGAGNAAVRVAASARIETAPTLSRDGRRLAFFSEQSGRRELWLSNADGTNPVQLTDFFAWDTLPPAWSPDGKHLAFASGHGPDGSAHGLFVIDVDDKQVRRLATEGEYWMPHWSHDGRWIFAIVGGAGNQRIVRIPAAGGPATYLTQAATVMPRESPDGRYLYYLKGSSRGIWRMPASGGAESPVLDEFPHELWSNWAVVDDGVYFAKRQEPGRATIEFYDLATRQTRRVAEMFGDPPLFEGGLTVAPDRRSIVYSRVSRSASDIMLVDNFR